MASLLPTVGHASIHHGSGPKPLPPELKRTVPIKCQLRPGQGADMAAIAEAWGVPMGTAVYGVIATFIAEARGMPVTDARDTLPVRASCLLLARMGVPIPKRVEE